MDISVYKYLQFFNLFPKNMMAQLLVTTRKTMVRPTLGQAAFVLIRTYFINRIIS